MASLGADVLICADLNVEAANDTAAMCSKIERSNNSKCGTFAYHIDVRDEAEVDGFIAQVAERHGRIDVLVNTAGVSLLPKLDSRDTWLMMIGKPKHRPQFQVERQFVIHLSLNGAVLMKNTILGASC